VKGDLELYPEDWGETAGSRRRREALLASVLLHVIGVVGLDALAGAMPVQVEKDRPRRPISLFLPPPEVLTQKEPNRAPPGKMFLGRPEIPRPPRKVEPKALAGAPPPAIVEPPKPVADSRQTTPKPEADGTTVLAQVIPPPGPVAPPKLVLEDAHGRSGGQRGAPQSGVLGQQRSSDVMEGAVRQMARNPGLRGTGVGDGFGGVIGGSTAPSPANAGSHLELLSDPMGVDFKPYLTQILAAVRRNWYAVIPESARLAMVRGRVTIQFIIVRGGAVSKLVIAGGAGVEALDRAAVAGISASNPFPPLPPEFRGDHVRLQFTFLYNLPAQ